MISRRNIRVKVMQTLYSLQGSTHLNLNNIQKEGQQILAQKLNQSLSLFAMLVAYTNSVAQYAETDARMRASKYLPTEADKNVNTKIAANTFLWKTLENESYQHKIKEQNILLQLDEDWIKKLYQQLCQLEAYKAYITIESRDPKQEKAMMRLVWTELMLNNEEFQNYLQDEMSDWEDDRDMICILMDNYFKNNDKINFLSLLGNEKLDFAKSLLQTTLDKEEYCLSLIEPKLINWETERIAQIDLILLKMGLCELLYFPTIPVKVTMNEYIEIAKTYSTLQSSHFVNAVLDKILKELEKEQKIQKKSHFSK